MYCGQCGKKVMENMLFCPFCGSPIVIPDQDSPSVAPVPDAAQPPQEAPAEPERPRSLFDAFDAPVSEPSEPIEAAQPVQAEAFVPLRFDFEDEREEPSPQEAQPEREIADVAPEWKRAEEAPPRPARRNAPELLRPENAQRRAANTFIPARELDPMDIFMDGSDGDDDYDDYDDDDYDLPRSRPSRDLEEDDDDFDFEEPEYGGFFQRHIRGIVGLILLILVAAICMIWAVSARGQKALAQVNLAWSAQAYADLGYAAYQQDSDLLAARYYEKAFARDGENYEYAHSAMVAYYEANEIESAAAMLKKCIALSPDDPEPYIEMLILYPESENRPWEITELVRQGYQRTGNAALKLD